MAESEIEEESTKKKKGGKLPLLLGLLLAVAGGGGGFWAVYSGMILGSDAHAVEAGESHEVDVKDMPDVAYVPLDQIIVSLGKDSSARHLQFRAQLEVPSKYHGDVEALVPRVIDVLNGYLRALEPADIEGSDALTKIRAQMLRRVQLVAGQGRVKDLLVMEFVLN